MQLHTDRHTGCHCHPGASEVLWEKSQWRQEKIVFTRPQKRYTEQFNSMYHDPIIYVNRMPTRFPASTSKRLKKIEMYDFATIGMLMNDFPQRTRYPGRNSPRSSLKRIKFSVELFSSFRVPDPHEITQLIIRKDQHQPRIGQTTRFSHILEGLRPFQWTRMP